MKNTLVCCIILFLFSGLLQGQHNHEKVYNWNWKKDGIALGVSAGLLGTSIYMRNNADRLQSEEVINLSRDDVWFFDKSAVDNTSKSSGQLSDIILYSSYSYPFVHFIDHQPHTGQSAVAGMFFENILITASLTNIIKATTKRKRPFVFNENLPLEERLSDNGTFSFPSGHTSIVTSLCFFSAKVHSDLFPESPWRKYIWAGAITIPGVVGYLRYKAGKHFPTDIMAGYGIGAVIGYLIPELHKVKNDKHDDHAIEEKLHFRVLAGPGIVGLNLNF